MTGRDLIMYILENGLEDAPIFHEGKPLGFITEAEAAVKFEVGLSTIRTWYITRQLEGMLIADHLFIPAKAERPNKGETNEKKNNAIVIAMCDDRRYDVSVTNT